MSFEQIQSKADRALERFESAKVKLYRDDKPVFAPDVHEEKMKEIMDPLTTAIDEASAALEAEIDSAKAELAVINHGDPAAILSDSELATANKRAAFVKEDCADLSAAELAGRLAAAAASNDRVTQWLHWRYGTRRADELQEQLRTTSTRGKQAQIASELGEITKQLTALKADLFPNQDSARAGITERITAAQKMQHELAKRLRIADGTDARDLAILKRRVHNLF
ncbi:MAG: hypothetical protein KDJ65_19465 [Anaerolineae bacterium]|nr:hypothetical protein [Anaerolineae bacterium]